MVFVKNRYFYNAIGNANMELKLNIDYENLLQLIKQLPSHQLDKLKSDFIQRSTFQSKG